MKAFRVCLSKERNEDIITNYLNKILKHSLLTPNHQELLPNIRLPKIIVILDKNQMQKFRCTKSGQIPVEPSIRAQVQ
jgi:hypothetical protein